MAFHQQQLRSTSLPVRPHALVQEIEDELQRLRSGAAASPSSSCCHCQPARLVDRLGDAYGRVEELVRLPGALSSSAQWWGAAGAELDTSTVALLDLCQRSRDAAATAKQHVRAARRAVRRGDTAAGRGYVRCLTEASSKECSAKQKALMRRRTTTEPEGKSEAAAVAVAVLRRVTSALSARVLDGTTRKPSKWRVVSKLLRSDDWWSSGRLCDVDDDDAVLRAQEMLQELDDTVQSIENGLEHLFRRLVQTRVALLNVLTL